ncbi:MAG TPA: GDP-L-fucose synthase [Candidatus Bathyarchaeia archaeon]|nr:GDP-L-fucose synthase [Candidatus Bathyarchaeia archaeon]
MPLDAKIYVAGHTGLVGSAIVRALQAQGYTTIITRTHDELDLTNQEAVNEFFADQQPDFVFLAAAKVGGIKANMDYPADFIYTNLMIEAHVIHASWLFNVQKLLFLGSSCIYPALCPQPIKEEYLLTGLLEWTNEPYAVAKIAGIKMCQSYNRQYGTTFIACMPTNLYGPNDNFDLNNAHVLPALLRKIYTAQQNDDPSISVWGSGKPYREFLYVDDLADACIFLMNYYSGNDIVNVGTGTDITILDLVYLIKGIVGYDGDIVFDATKPDGTPKKQLNIDKLSSLGWSAQTSLTEGIEKTLVWCIEQGKFN